MCSVDEHQLTNKRLLLRCQLTSQSVQGKFTTINLVKLTSTSLLSLSNFLQNLSHLDSIFFCQPDKIDAASSAKRTTSASWLIDVFSFILLFSLFRTSQCFFVVLVYLWLNRTRRSFRSYNHPLNLPVSVLQCSTTVAITSLDQQKMYYCTITLSWSCSESENCLVLPWHSQPADLRTICLA